MPFNGSGTFTRVHGWISDRNNGIKITADRHDEEDDNFKDGLTAVITKDGQTTTTDRIPFSAGIGLNAGSETAPAINFITDTNTGIFHKAADKIGFAAGGDEVMEVTANGLGLPNGSAATPSLTFTSDTDLGLYRKTGNTGAASAGGSEIFSWSASGVQCASGGRFSGSGSIPVGAIMDFGGSTAPSDWLLCAGQAVSRTTYSALFAVIGTSFGMGNGSTTFNVPDLRGRTTASPDNMGGSDASRMSGVTFTSGDRGTIGATVGTPTHALTESELAEHDHGPGTFQAVDHNPTFTVNSVVDGNDGQLTVATGEETATRSVTGTSGTAGSGAAHLNMQPTILVSRIIYTGPV